MLSEDRIDKSAKRQFLLFTHWPFLSFISPPRASPSRELGDPVGDKKRDRQFLLFMYLLSY